MGLFHPTDPERWYPVPGLPNYQISSRLRTRKVRTYCDDGSVSTCKYLEESYSTDGYRIIPYRIGKKTGRVKFHHVVAELVYGPRPEGFVCRHLDDDKSNNWPDNLAYGTQIENLADAKRNGRLVRVEDGDGSRVRLAPDQVKAARLLARKGIAPGLIAAVAGVSLRSITAVLDGSILSHIKGEDDLLAEIEGAGCG